MKKLILLGFLLLLSTGCVTTTGVGVSHIWGDSSYVYPYIGGYTGAYFGSWGVSYLANPIFYTPYYYRRVYVKPPPIRHHYGYGGSHKAVFPADNKPHNIGVNAVKPPLITTQASPASVTVPTSSALSATSVKSPVVAYYHKGNENRNNMPATQASTPYRGNRIINKNNENKPPVPAPQRNDNFNTGNRPASQAQHINNSSNRRENSSAPTIRAQQQSDNFTRGYAQQRGESSRTAFGINNGNNRMGGNSGFGNRSGARR